MPEVTIEERKQVIVKVKYNGVVLSTEEPNNTVLLKDGSVASIQEFKKNTNDNIGIVVKSFLRKESIFEHPCDSSMLKMFEVTKLSPLTRTILIDDIRTKLVKFKLNFSTTESNQKTFVVPLLH